jgi:stress responsive alpha/beta barrel protein
MLRHVVLFTWSDTAEEERRTSAESALRRLEHEIGGMSSLFVASDAGLVEGNADTVLIADFPDAAAFDRYGADPVHQAVLDEYVRPWLAGRAAVQFTV